MFAYSYLSTYCCLCSPLWCFQDSSHCCVLCNFLSTCSPSMSITSAPYRALDSTTPFLYVFPIITRWQLFSMTEFVITPNRLIFSSFRSFVLQTHFSLLVLSLLSILFLPLFKYYLFFSHFSFMLNRMH